jgi:GT2 family glycosyltransferase
MEITKIAIIIVTWNKIKQVCLLLKDLNELELPNINLDIYVVDNASTDGTQSYLEEYCSDQVKVLQTGSNLGGSGGFSCGLQFVSKLDYNYIWLLDDDVRLDSLALVALINTLQNYEEVGVVGSQIRKLQKPNAIQEIGSFINNKKAHLEINFGNQVNISTEEILQGKPYVNVDICAAASLLIRCEIVQHMGVFEDYFLHFDDVEWCLRIKQAGWVIAVNPHSIVWHDSPDFKSRPWMNYYDERNLCYCWQKHRPELLLKRVVVSFPRLVYYAATGRYFLAEISIAGFQDFINGVQGKMLRKINYTECTLEEIIHEPAKVFVQSTIYQDEFQSQNLKKIEVDKKVTFWPSPNKFSRIWLWIIAWFWKPIDIAIITYQHPTLDVLNLAKWVYYFTGNGYVPVVINPLVLTKAVIKTSNQMWQIYWQIRKLKLSSMPEIMPTPLSPLVSIIICTSNRPNCLEKALQSLGLIRYQNFEVIVIDASSTNQTIEIVNQVSSKNDLKINFLQVKPKNISYSRNMGIKLATGSIVAFFDDDAIPPSEWIDKLLDIYAVHDEKCAAVGGTVRDLTRPGYPLQFHRGITNLFSETIAIRSADATNYNQANGLWFNGLMGTNCSFRKDILEKINGYDEFFDYFLDETDVCLRLIQAGYEVHYADVVIDHYPQPSHNRIDQKHLTCWYSLAKNTTYFAIKHGLTRGLFPIFVTRLFLLITYRCWLRIIRLKFTHHIPNSVLIKYFKQTIEGIRIGWKSGMDLHQVN